MIGWIKLHRQITESKVWLDKPFSRGQAWLDILLNTSYEESSFWSRGIQTHVKPGQCSLSVLSMSERWGWSRGKVGRFLAYLKNEHQIEHQKSNVTTLITVTNWEKYQANEHQNGHQTDTRRTPDGHIKEVKELKEVKEQPTPGGEKISLPELKTIYSATFRDMLPTQLVIDRLQWMIDNFDKAAIINRFEGAASAKAKSLNYITNGMTKEIEEKAADDEMWANMGESNE